MDKKFRNGERREVVLYSADLAIDAGGWFGGGELQKNENKNKLSGQFIYL